jgi:hypothetical protein
MNTFYAHSLSFSHAKLHSLMLSAYKHMDIQSRKLNMGPYSWNFLGSKKFISTKNLPNRDSAYVRGILSQLIDLYNGQTNFDLRLIITLDLSTQKLLFTDVLSPQYSIVIKILMFYMNIGNVPLIILS